MQPHEADELQDFRQELDDLCHIRSYPSGAWWAVFADDTAEYLWEET